MKLTTAQLIKHYRELAGLNQSELARRVGISPQAVQHWEQNNANPRTSLLPKIASTLGVEPRDLALGAPLRTLHPDDEPVEQRAPQPIIRPRSPTAPIRQKETVVAPHTSVTLAPVEPTSPPGPTRVMITHLTQQQDEVPDVEMIVVSQTWVARHLPGRNPQDIAVLEAYGDAHAPTLQHGDWLLVDTGRKGVDFDAVWVLRHRSTGEFWVRRVHRRIDGGWTLMCDNPAYAPREVTPDERKHFDVVGQACRRVNFAPM